MIPDNAQPTPKPKYRRVTDTRFSWYDPIAHMETRKRQFHGAARARLLILADLMGWLDSHYDLRTNPGGPAVAGDTILHHGEVYILVSQPLSKSPDSGILVRRCAGRKDYVGEQNCFTSLRMLDDLPALCEFVKDVMAKRTPSRRLN